ncbi:hypothetical protein M422DRAFT_38170 [Sphaerobolus stellatus SS14]|uniref:Unplaced genomic scaffold SPHSTscaffold_289, whole genome shotgun sequence n=1 Tax=Sphaerobolus stellatus (strain SS14) TaxID=990650 RepID=A0A0C9UBU3_SPHS4|nr:hypothetical protein M422DRAFT_38170 [Sphaerobolus stellatus SS14]
MFTLLRHSPNLEVHIHWPNLRRLSLTSTHISPSTATRFFERHPTITSLHISARSEYAVFIKRPEEEDEDYNPEETEEWNDGWNEDGTRKPEFEVKKECLPNCKDACVPKAVWKALFPGVTPTKRQISWG